MSIAYSNSPSGRQPAIQVPRLSSVQNQRLSSGTVSRQATARAPQRHVEAQAPSLRLVLTEGLSRNVLGAASMRAVMVFIGGAVAVILAGLQLSIMIQQGSYQLAGLKSQLRDLTTTNQILDEQVRSLSSDQNLANAAANLGMVTNANPVYLRIADGKVIGHPTVAGSGFGVQIGKNVVPNAALVAVTTKGALEASTKAAQAASNAAKAAAAASAAAALHPAVSTKAANSTSSGVSGQAAAFTGGGAIAATGASVANATGKAAKVNVAANVVAAPKVVLASSGIPVSPTH